MSRLFLFATALQFVTMASCDIGPAHPDRDAPRYLRQRGYSDATISKVLGREDLKIDKLQELASEKSSDVRFLVAQNPNLPEQLYEKLLHDDDSFVRGGAALSPNISASQALSISKNDNHTVKLYLARNPSVPEDILIDLHEKHGMELVWFAFNPKCPEELIQKMKLTNDSDALRQLDNMREREKFKKKPGVAD